jgi:arginine deiminase
MGWLADLLKEIPSAARYKAELEKLTSEHKSLESKLTAAEAKIRELEGKLSARQGKRLEGVREEMLVALIEESWVSDSTVAEALSITVPLATYHLNELYASGFIESVRSGIVSNEANRRISQKGREYLVTHGLL